MESIEVVDVDPDSLGGAEEHKDLGGDGPRSNSKEDNVQASPNNDVYHKQAKFLDKVRGTPDVDERHRGIYKSAWQEIRGLARRGVPCTRSVDGNSMWEVVGAVDEVGIKGVNQKEIY